MQILRAATNNLQLPAKLRHRHVHNLLMSHLAAHSYATNQLTKGTDLFTVSKMLGHTNIKTTQIYAKVVDSKKEQAADAIKLVLHSDVTE